MRKIVSFDFDGVLHKSVIKGTTDPINYDQPETWIPFEETFEIMFREALKGSKIIVVSKRHGLLKPYMKSFIEKYDLPVSEIHCTECRSKFNILTQLKVAIHYDDHPELIEELDGTGISFVLVNPFTTEFKKYF